MGLLSRMGGGIVQAARPGGPMSKLVEMSFLEEQKEEDRTFLEEQKKEDRTYLAGAELTKHNRLVGREKEAFKRLTSAADTKWNRDLDLLDRKTKEAIKVAQSTGKVEYYKQALASQEAVILKIEEKLSAYLTTGQFEQIDPEMRERKFKAFNAAKERLRAAQETYNTLDAQFRAATGLPPSLGLDTEDFDINAAVNMAAEEIIRSGEEEGATGLISVPTMTDQIKSINDMLERNKMPIMTPEQETSFRELVEAQVRGIGGQQMPSEVSTALGVKPEMSIYERQKMEADARRRQEAAITEERDDGVVVQDQVVVDDEAEDPSGRFRVPEGETIGGRAIRGALKWLIEGFRVPDKPLPFFTQTKDSAIQKEISKLSAEGQLFWTYLGAAIEEVGLESALDSLADQFQSLSNADKKILHGLNSSIPSDKSFFSDPANIFGASKDVMIEDLIEKFSKPARA